MDARRYLRLARRAWALLLVGVVLGGGAAFGVSAALPERYTATTQLFVSTTGADDLSTAVQGNYYAQGKVASYAQLATSKELASAVIDDLGLDATAQQVMSRLSATVVTDTTILDITVTDDTAQGAYSIARSVDTQFADLVDDLETPRGTTTSPIKITVIATPELPTAPSSPNLRANVALGAVLGLVLAVLVAVVRDRLDTTVKDDDTASALTGAPVIGHVPVAAHLSEGQPPAPHTSSPAAEAIRHVRTNLAFLDVDRPPRTILLTSSVPGEGKTTLAGHLAVALAESGNRVALVEGDLRRPRLTRYLGLVSGVGVTSVLTGAAELDEVLQPVRDGALEVLGAGPLPPNPSELLASEAFATLLAELAGTHDVVLIDAPPLLPVADAGALAGLVDGVLLCARWGKVDAEDLQRSAASLDRLGARLLGVVMTQVPHRAAPVAYGYGVQPASTRRRWARRRAPQGPAIAVPPVRPRTAQSTPLAESRGH
ncbi:polysaccharide biosynthesis tyrosine autokinase [Petropleomorpha daqingensis]|uniref:Non-specific protein-tyrosine kinase n=1 Tax=Petropleomorpha daqingensis TaxID=2026353 RepID=A0A853CHY1_9ACTN|nr:polysaccharide biosynthesis tyrosine autokinase [Petropleomorpha daqingensis]NYJ05878.1 non-specific protein-tyrosine kinase [Petropleomorpha daqingensis]